MKFVFLKLKFMKNKRLYRCFTNQTVKIMKKSYLLAVCLFTAGIVFAQDDVVIYGDETPNIVWQNFAGPTNVQEVDNPTPDDVNSTERCLSILRPKETGGSDEIGWHWEGALSESFSVPNIEDYNSISMLVKKPYPGKVCIELQSPTGGSSMIYAEYTATDNSWQKLIFPVINVNALGETGLTKVLIEIHREDENNNDAFEDCIMYADELTLHKAMPEFAFNGEDRIAGGWLPFPSDEFSKKAMLVDNPDKTGINTTEKCLWMKREKNDEVFSGAINRNFKVLDLNLYKYITMMFKKSVAGPVSLELQSPGEAKKQVLTTEYTDAGKWQQLMFEIPENVLEGEPLQIIILQAHVVDTREDASFTDPMDVYMDELYLANENMSAVLPVWIDDNNILQTEVFDLSGSRVKVFSGSKIDMESMVPGVYIIRKIAVDGQAAVVKMIVNK